MSFSLLSTLLPLLLGPALTVLPNVGVTLPNAAPPDPASEAARFEAVSKQLDPGGVLHAYVSVDGDLSAIGAYVKSFMDDIVEQTSRYGRGVQAEIQKDAPNRCQVCDCGGARLAELASVGEFGEVVGPGYEFQVVV